MRSTPCGVLADFFQIFYRNVPRSDSSRHPAIQHRAKFDIGFIDQISRSASDENNVQSCLRFLYFNSVLAFNSIVTGKHERARYFMRLSHKVNEQLVKYEQSRCLFKTKTNVRDCKRFTSIMVSARFTTNVPTAYKIAVALKILIRHPQTMANQTR